MFSAGPGGSSRAMSSATEQLNAMLGHGGLSGFSSGAGGAGGSAGNNSEDIVSGVHEWRNIQVCRAASLAFFLVVCCHVGFGSPSSFMFPTHTHTNPCRIL